MAGLRITFSLVLCLCLATQTYAYSGGAPDGACASMTPSHGVAPQNGPAPYQVTTSKSSVGPGEQIDVTLSGNGPFKGFFFRARQNNNFVDGQFQPNGQGQLRCNGQGITHNSPTDKTTVTVTWTAPANIGSSPIQFVATVVQQRVTFWTFVTSPDVAVGGAPTGGMPTTGSATPPMGSGTMPTGSGGSMQPGTGSTSNTQPANTGNNDDDDDDDDRNSGTKMKVGLGWLIAAFVAACVPLCQK